VVVNSCKVDILVLLGLVVLASLSDRGDVLEDHSNEIKIWSRILLERYILKTFKWGILLTSLSGDNLSYCLSQLLGVESSLNFVYICHPVSLLLKNSIQKR
jgi:hypothetical protein